MIPNQNRILIVDDEPDIIEFLTYNLTKEGFEVHSVGSGAEVFSLADKINPHLILLDIMMPEMDGVEVCKQLRESPKFQNTIIAFLTARNEDYSQIAGFESGGDDYIPKPIKPRVLISRIHALLKRYNNALISKTKTPKDISLRGIMIDAEKYQLSKDGKHIVLPKKELELISLLMSKPGKVFTREEILNEIWGEDVIVDSRTIDVHIRKLREKLGENFIKTIIGVGYKFES